MPDRVFLGLEDFLDESPERLCQRNDHGSFLHHPVSQHYLIVGGINMDAVFFQKIHQFDQFARIMLFRGHNVVKGRLCQALGHLLDCHAVAESKDVPSMVRGRLQDGTG